jgi:proline iminopeptidase
VHGVDAVHEVAASFAGARTVVLPGAGHFPWVDEPAAFSTAVAEFLRGSA